MNCAQIVQYAAETTGDISSDALDYAKRALRLKYDTLYVAHNWREATRVIDGYILDSTLKGVLFLPQDAEEIVFLSLSYDGQSYIRLSYRERDWIERFATPAFTLPGNTPWFFRGENLAWPYLSPGRFTFTSVNKSPFTIYIEGRDANNFPISETFSLQGVINPDNTVNPQSISTLNSYKVVTSLSKDITDSPLQISTESPGTQTVQMPPGMTELVFTQIILAPPPLFTDANGVLRNVYIRTQVKLKPDTLDNDYSVPRISSVWDALVSFVTSSLYRRLQQVAKAQATEQEAMEHVKAAINKEKNQAEFRQQVVPTTYETGDYLDGWWWKADSGNPFGAPWG